MLKRCGSLIAALVCSLTLAPSVSAFDGTFSTSIDGIYIGVDSTGKLVGCDYKGDCTPLKVPGKIKSVRTTYDDGGYSPSNKSLGSFILTETGDVYLQRFPPDTSSYLKQLSWPSPERVLPGVKVSRISTVGWKSSNNLIAVFITEDGEVLSYSSAYDQYSSPASERHPEIKNVTEIGLYVSEFDGSFPGAVVRSDGSAVIFQSEELFPFRFFNHLENRFEFKEIALPDNHKIKDITFTGNRGKDVAVFALDEKGFLWKAALDRKWGTENSIGTFILKDWEKTLPEVRFTSIEASYGLTHSGKLWDLGTDAGEAISGIYKDTVHPLVNPRVFTYLHNSTELRIMDDTSGTIWTFYDAAQRDHCLSVTFTEHYGLTSWCGASPYDALQPILTGHPWQHRSVVVPTKPSVKEQCGTTPVVVVPPETDKVRYERVSVPKGNGTEETVTAYPKLGWVITGQSSWKYDLTPSAPCPTTPVPPPPEDTVAALPPSPTTTTAAPVTTAVITTTPVTKPTTPVVSATLAQAKPTSAEPSATIAPTTSASWFKPWYLLAGLVVPFLIPHPAPQPAPGPSLPPSSQIPASTSSVPEVKAEGKSKGIVSGVLAYEHRPWLVALGVLLISVCIGAGVVLRRKDND